MFQVWQTEIIILSLFKNYSTNRLHRRKFKWGERHAIRTIFLWNYNWKLHARGNMSKKTITFILSEVYYSLILSDIKRNVHFCLARMHEMFWGEILTSFLVLKFLTVILVIELNFWKLISPFYKFSKLQNSNFITAIFKFKYKKYVMKTPWFVTVFLKFEFSISVNLLHFKWNFYFSNLANFNYHVLKFEALKYVINFKI